MHSLLERPGPRGGGGASPRSSPPAQHHQASAWVMPSSAPQCSWRRPPPDPGGGDALESLVDELIRFKSMLDRSAEVQSAFWEPRRPRRPRSPSPSRLGRRPGSGGRVADRTRSHDPGGPPGRLLEQFAVGGRPSAAVDRPCGVGPPYARTSWTPCATGWTRCIDGTSDSDRRDQPGSGGWPACRSVRRSSTVRSRTG
ncbi:hypothetical protein QJS66_00270 [Kocuria rhizophila]|nr:hypothetical protein QJS66_00270 [Kocuria rhizophila]